MLAGGGGGGGGGGGPPPNDFADVGVCGIDAGGGGGGGGGGGPPFAETGVGGGESGVGDGEGEYSFEIESDLSELDNELTFVLLLFAFIVLILSTLFWAKKFSKRYKD